MLCYIIENKPTLENPKTSFLVSLSVLRILKKAVERGVCKT